MVTQPSDLGELAAALTLTSSASDLTCEKPNLSQQGHLESQRSSQGPSTSGSLPAESGTSSNVGTRISAFAGVLVPRFFELCVNTGEFSKTLAEIDVTRVTSDMSFFKLVHQRYREVRGYRYRKHYLLKAVAMQFVLFGMENGHRISTCKKKIAFLRRSMSSAGNNTISPAHHDTAP